MLNQSGKRFAAFLLCLALGCALFASAGGEERLLDQLISVNPEEMKATAAELQALAAEVASRKEQLKEMINQLTGTGAAMSDLYDTKLPAVLKDFEEIESGILNAAGVYEEKTDTTENAAESFSSSEEEQDHSLEINLEELSELAAKLEDYASFLADLQMQLEERGITLQCNFTEAIERVQGMKEDITAWTAAVNRLDDDMVQAETTTIPSFTFDELNFPDHYARTEEVEYTTTQGIHTKETRSYDADGFEVYRMQVAEDDGTTVTRYFWMTKIGDSGYVATKVFSHMDVPPGHTVSRNDFWYYFVYNDSNGNHTVTVVDENGKPKD